MNGFELAIDENAELGQRVSLLALPVSKGTEFGVDGEPPSWFCMLLRTTL